MDSKDEEITYLCDEIVRLKVENDYLRRNNVILRQKLHNIESEATIADAGDYDFDEADDDEEDPGDDDGFWSRADASFNPSEDGDGLGGY